MDEEMHGGDDRKEDDDAEEEDGGLKSYLRLCETAEAAMAEKLFLCTQEDLVKLVPTFTHCSICKAPVSMSTVYIGTCLTIAWVKQHVLLTFALAHQRINSCFDGKPYIWQRNI